MTKSEEWLTIFKGCVIGFYLGLMGGSTVYITSGKIPIFTTIGTGIILIWSIFAYITYRKAKRNEK